MGLQTVPIGERHALQISSAPGGWELRVISEKTEPLGSIVVTPQQMIRLVRRGITITQLPLEVRGLKWEIEFRDNNVLVGRVRKDDFLLAVGIVPPG